MNDPASRAPAAGVVQGVEGSGALALLGMAWDGRWLISGCAFACALLAAIYSLTLPSTYTATVIATQATRASAEPAGLGMVAQSYGLRALQGSTQVEEYLAVMQARSFVDELVRQKNLAPVLLPKDWDAEKNQWRVREGSFIGEAIAGAKGWVMGLFQPSSPTADRAGPDTPGEMAAKRAVALFQNRLTVSHDRRRGVISVSFTWQDPALAAAWANDVVALLNAHTQQDAIDESRRRYDYLQGELARSTNAENRDMVYRLMTRELQNTTLASSQTDYALKIIDPAVPPLLPSGPGRSKMALLGLVLGCMLGAALCVVRELRQRRT